MPILDFSAIRIAIVREAQRITGVTCMVAQPETPTAPRPPKPYLSLKFNQVGEKQGNDAANCVSGALWNVGGQRGLTVDFNSYGRTHEEAYELMLTLQAHLEGGSGSGQFTGRRHSDLAGRVHCRLERIDANWLRGASAT